MKKGQWLAFGIAIAFLAIIIIDKLLSAGLVVLIFRSFIPR